MGNPIDPSMGLKFQRETDYAGSGPVPLQFERFYNSFGAGSGVVLGTAWRHTFDRSLVVSSLISSSQTLLTVHVYRPDGQVLSFQNQSGSWQTDGDTSTTLAGSWGVGYTYTDGNDNVEQYDANGLLLSITSRSGVVQALSYNSSGQLATVTDSFGRTLSFAYYANGLLHTVTDPAAGVFTYAYDASQRLVSVTYPDTQVRQYVYNESAYTSGVNLPNALTGIIDENGQRFATYTYDATARAIGSQHAGGAQLVTVTYNADGSATVADALGASRTYTYQTIWNVPRLSSVTGQLCTSCGEYASYGYDTNGNLQSWTTARGVIYNASWTTDGRNLRTNYGEALGDSIARGTNTQWSATYRLPTQIQLSNRQTNYTYDPNGNALTKTIKDTSSGTTRTWTYTYDSYGNVLTITGPRTDVSDLTTYTYNNCSSGGSCGQVKTITDALNHVTSFTSYNSHGQPLTITDPNGIVTTLMYDGRMRLTSRNKGGESTVFTYWPTGLLKTVTLPDNSYVLYTYDNAHRLTKISDGQGNYIQYNLDAMGNRLSDRAYDPTNTLHKVVYRTYNALGELYQQIGAANSQAVTTTYGYDADGNQTTIGAPMSRNTTTAYDKLNRISTVTDPGNGQSSFSYDAYDNLTSVYDPLYFQTQYSYNNLGDLTAISSRDTGTTTKTYDTGGNLATSTDARGAVSTYSYDALNRVTSAAYSLGSTTDQTITFTYDAGTYGKGRLTGESDATHGVSWAYDALGRVTGKTQTANGIALTVGYAYGSGNLTTVTTPSGQSIGYSYNANHQIAGITLNGSSVLSGATYEPMGPVNGWTWGNGTATSRTYDSDGKTAQISSAGVKTYAYDNAFRITGIADTSTGALNWTYGYDALDRITSGSASGISRGWTYDANGNRLSETGSAPSTYRISSFSNQITSITGTLSRTYSYDSAGDTLSDSTVTATYNDRGRLLTLANGSSNATYVYNAIGQMAMSSGTSGTTLYMYDEGGHLLGEYDGHGSLIEETVWLGEIPVATLRPNGSTVSVYYVHTDQLNTPRQVTRPSDNTQMWSWFSDPFGTDPANTNPAGAGTFAYSLRFPGQVFGGQVGLHQNYFRDYDPVIGRYVESDPIGLAAGVNTYTYGNANPISNSDPTGLFVPPALPGPTAAVTVAGYVGYGIGTAIYDAYGLQINDAIDAIVGPPQPDSNVIPFPQRPKQSDNSNNCPPDDGCDRDQKILLGQRLVLTNMLSAGTLRMPDYATKAKAFNERAAVHNARCPGNKVAPVSLGPRGV